MVLPKLGNSVRPTINLISYLYWSRTCVWWLGLLILKVFCNLKSCKKPKGLVAVGLDHHHAPLAMHSVRSVLHPLSWSGVCFYLACSSHPYSHLCCFSSKWSCQRQLLSCRLSPCGSFEEGEQAQQFFFWDTFFLSTGSCKIADNELVHS